MGLYLMAKADLELKVAVEKAIHTALQDVAQTIWDEHGICVEDVSIDWVDVSTPVEPKMFVTELTTRMRTKV